MRPEMCKALVRFSALPTLGTGHTSSVPASSGRGRRSGSKSVYTWVGVLGSRASLCSHFWLFPESRPSPRPLCGSAPALNATLALSFLCLSVCLFVAHLFASMCVWVCHAVEVRAQFARVGFFYHASLRDKIQVPRMGAGTLTLLTSVFRDPP